MLFSSREGCKTEGWLLQTAHLVKCNENTVCAPNINVLLHNTAVPQNIQVWDRVNNIPLENLIPNECSTGIKELMCGLSHGSGKLSL